MALCQLKLSHIFLVFLNYLISIFFLITLLICLSSCFVLFFNNAVFSVFSLIITFLLSGVLLFFFSIEFLGFLFLIIYIGAIAILFLFVVMLIDLNSLIGRFYLKKRVIVFFFLFFIIFCLVQYRFFNSFYLVYNNNKIIYESWVYLFFTCTDIEIIGSLIYTNNLIGFIIMGLLFFLSLLGVILLINKLNEGNMLVKKQDLMSQISRRNVLKI